MADQELLRDSPEQPPAEVLKPELKRRAGIQFSGATGAVVASGYGAVTTAPTYGLVQDVIEYSQALSHSNAGERELPCSATA